MILRGIFMADYVGGDMIRGHIDTIILNVLLDGDKDTNQIRAEIEARAGGQFQLKQGTFYSALQRIVKQGYVIEYRTTGPDGVRRKYFQLTEKGKDLIDKNQSSWAMSQQVINTLLDASQPTPTPVVVVQSNDNEEVIPEFEEPKVTNFSNLQNIDNPEEESVAVQVVSSIEDDDDDLIKPDSTTVEEVLEIDESTDDTMVALTEVPPTFNPEEYNDATPQTFDDIMSILENIDRSAQEEEDKKLREEENKLERERILAEEKAKAEEEERLIAAQVEQARLERDRKLTDVDIPDEFQIAEERSTNPSVYDEISDTPVIPDYIADSLSEEEKHDEPIVEVSAPVDPVKTEQLTLSSIEPPVDQANEPDDYLDPNDLPSQKEYKDVLTRIFASDMHENVVEFPTEVTHSTTSEPIIEAVDPVVSTSTVIEINDDKYDRIVDDLDFSEENDKENDKKTVKSETVRSKKKKSSGSFDYSDIMTMSEKDGLKVNTSDRTNKSELGKILINRLNFHTSLIFFFLIALETLVIWLTMEKILNFGMEPYIYFTIAIFIFPLLCGMIYYMAPKRTVAELSTFKSSFETSLIITLNLILMTLVYVVIIDLDFSSIQQITRDLFLPILIVINIPIYIIIRYSLLEKQMYFS